jgi:hypothetical protein
MHEAWVETTAELTQHQLVSMDHEEWWRQDLCCYGGLLALLVHMYDKVQVTALHVPCAHRVLQLASWHQQPNRKSIGLGKPDYCGTHIARFTWDISEADCV